MRTTKYGVFKFSLTDADRIHGKKEKRKKRKSFHLQSPKPMVGYGHDSKPPQETDDAKP